MMSNILSLSTSESILIAEVEECLEDCLTTGQEMEHVLDILAQQLEEIIQRNYPHA